MSELLSLIKTRRSVRKLKDRAVPLSSILEALDAARWAPSAHNAQPWRFVVLAEAEAKKRLAEAMAEAWRRDLEGDGVPEEEVEALVG